MGFFSPDILNFKASSIDFVRDGQILSPRFFLTTPPLENGLVKEILLLGNF